MKLNFSTDLETETTPDGKQRCEECWNELQGRKYVAVRCTNVAVKQVQFELEGSKTSDGTVEHAWIWTCGQKAGR